MGRRTVTPLVSKEQTALQFDAPINLTPLRFVTIKLASQLTGYSPRAIEGKVQRRDWQENQVWRRAPDGRVLIDLQGYLRWVMGR